MLRPQSSPRRVEEPKLPPRRGLIVDDVVARLRSHGAELVGETAQYEDIYRLCFLRDPEGIIIGLAEQIG